MQMNCQREHLCPVCGSCHHPKKAELLEGGITANMVEEARISRDKANERRSEAALFVVQKHEECRHQEELIKKDGRTLDWSLYRPGILWENVLYWKKRKPIFLLINTEKEEKRAREAEAYLKELNEKKLNDISRMSSTGTGKGSVSWKLAG